MNTLFQRILLIIFSGALLVTAAWCTLQIYTLSSKRAEIKFDYSEVNSISYGLLSINVWSEHLTNIAMNRISDFELSPAQEDTLKYAIDQMLYAVVNKADSLVNQKQKTFKGKLTKFAVNTFVNKDKIEALVPTFSQTLTDEIQEPENKKALKYLVRTKVQEYTDSTYAEANDSLLVNTILAKNDVASIKEFNRKSEVTLQQLQEETYFFTYIVLGIILIYLLLWWILRYQKAVHTPFFVVSVLLALVVLGAGLTTPMIEIDARFKEVSFYLIGEHISFNDQILFFQSKSIVDVVLILLETGKYDSILVGLLILIFSIVFPIAKLLATQIYLAGKGRWKNNKLIQFFAFKSGKWSMADVYVIAIFMAYVGFQGILEDQLAILNVESDALVSISTNETSLQPGFILFIAFVLFSLLLSVILQRITALRKYM
ncbi:paraquat-inducible protein A [Catalinimonas niigatensis]|uniref:paraquat-inducible protein A n=1 Tax=Catalinimonas niigatensis TaxID=1397264 RepID=UPI0026661707|nr:paraquat-inducible protein A [Catalinimonas niigatensis]WPP50023.1 paraquat-inducible protein A [Catalinimonas niigatensis]